MLHDVDFALKIITLALNGSLLVSYLWDFGARFQCLPILVTEVPVNLVNQAKFLKDVDYVEPGGHLLGYILDRFSLQWSVILFDQLGNNLYGLHDEKWQ